MYTDSRFREKKNKIDELFKDPAMTFHYKIALDAAKFKRRIATYYENTEKKIHK